jgi:hypothetical protein
MSPRLPHGCARMWALGAAAVQLCVLCTLVALQQRRVEQSSCGAAISLGCRHLGSVGM